MKKFIRKHIILLVGILLLIVLPKVVISLGYWVCWAYYSLGGGIVLLIINGVTFVLCLNHYKKQSQACEDWAIILSLAGGGIGSKLSSTLFGNKPSKEDVGLIYHYFCELDLFLFVVCPIFMLMSNW
ncbi:MAG: hypothetical protein IJ035_10960 [Oscillospiraceae bacterium]|nr:hypothetical protein [Oscillospiraceae bacterium]